jgi:hypothetical protein
LILPLRRQRQQDRRFSVITSFFSKEITMSQKTLLYLIICLIGLLLAAGCTPVCTHEELDLHTIFDQQPNDGAISSSLNPTFTWGYTPTCNPYQFRIETSKNVSGPGITYYVNGTEREYTVGTAWDPGSKYYWRIYTISSDDYLGPVTEEYILYTGPMCPSSTPLAPVLDYPADGEFISPIKEYLDIDFHWHYPGDCLPSSYIYEFATDPNFQNILESGQTADHNQFVGLSFPDCTTIYWHVAAVNGTQTGPFSDTHSFSWIWDPTCWMNHYPSDDIAIIRGRVYQDNCDQTGLILANPLLLHQGCVNTTKFGVIGNGSKDPGEPGLHEVQVNLGAGACPSIGLDSFSTWTTGQYKFTVLTPGVYCLSISKEQHIDGKNLEDGLWTQPPTTNTVAEYTITLGPGFHQVQRFFGWDPYDVPVKKFTQPTNCRAGDSTLYHILHIFEAGDFAPLAARNEKGDWYLALVGDMRCYVYDQGDDDDEKTKQKKGGLPIYEPPPPPTPMPTTEPTNQSGCQIYTSEASCLNAGCTWVDVAGIPQYCK